MNDTDPKTPSKNPLLAQKQHLIGIFITPTNADDHSQGILFHDPHGNPYADIQTGYRRIIDGEEIDVMEPRQSVRIGSELWDDILYRLWWELTKTPLPKGTKEEITTTVAAFARTDDRPTHNVYRRIGKNDDGHIVIDLGGNTAKHVVCTPSGWTIEDRGTTGVYFEDSHAALPVPVHPKGTDSLNLLRNHLNIQTETDWALVVGWLLASCRPTGPYPILVLTGEAGTAKTSNARILRSVIDPHEADVRTFSDDIRTMAVAVTSQWALAFDNLTTISSRASDMLCQISTGGTFAARTLYTNTGETRVSLQRPTILTSIADVVTKPDLMDRALVVDLQPIPEEHRRTEDEVNTAFAADRPLILGALLDAVCTALFVYPTLAPTRLPRLADFAKWMIAASPALGWDDQHFLDIYGSNREIANAIALDTNPWTTILTEWLDRHLSETNTDRWWGTPTSLSGILNGQNATDPNGKPFNGRTLTAELKKLSPNLRSQGTHITFNKRTGKDGRTYTITRTGDPISTTDAPSPPVITKTSTKPFWETDETYA